MSAWRRKAIELLPEYKALIEGCETPMFLWTELHLAFHRVAEEENRPLMQRLFDYARWCWLESPSQDTQTAALLGFYENIPSDRRHWWTLATSVARPDFKALEQVFRYFLSEEQFAEFTADYLRNRDLIEKQILKNKKRTRPRTSGDNS